MHKHTLRLSKLATPLLVVTVAVFGFALTAHADDAGSGAIWTTTGSCGDPQNVNQYHTGETVFINGAGFSTNHEYDWVIRKPGVNGDILINGQHTTDADGKFCFPAVSLDAGANGVYQVKFGEVKGDNFKVVSIPRYTSGDTCPRGYTPELLDSYDINSTDKNGVNFGVTAGNTYLFHASGWYNASNNIMADAGYSWNQSGPLPDYGINGTGSNYGAHALLGDLGDGVGVVMWGVFNAQNIYDFYYQPTTNNIQFLIGDRYSDWFNTPWDNQKGMKDDNSGLLTLDVYECQPEPMKIVAHKITCEDYADLPEWGVGAADIDKDTAQNWVTSHKSCDFAKDWKFEWGDHNAKNPGDTHYGTAAEAGKKGWHTFGPTDSNGMATTTIDDIQKNFWFREVLQLGYIPFTYGPEGNRNTNSLSAQVYCKSDVLNYDNYDRIDDPHYGETIYCVAFNAEVPDPSVIQGRKYDDVNGNGYHDSNDTETRMDGWTTRLYDENWNSVEDMNSNNSMVTGDTGNPGQFAFDVMPGTYNVCEVMQNEWQQTGPLVGTHPVNFDLQDQNDATAVANQSGMHDEGSTCWQVEIDAQGGESYGWLKFGNYYAECGNKIKDSDETCDDGAMNGQPGYCNNECTGVTATDEKKIQINKTVDPAIATHGDTITYTITATNADDTDTCDNATLTITDDITDVLADAVLVSTDPSVVPDNNVLTWTFDNVSCGDPKTATVTVEVTNEAFDGAVVENIAWVMDQNENQATSKQVETAISVDSPVLELTKTAAEGPFNPGQTVEYTVTVTNNGTADATNVVLTDALPDNMMFQDGTTTKTWTWDIIAVGTSQEAAYTAIIDDEATANTYTNNATVTADSLDPVSASADTEVIVPIVLGDAAPFFNITKTADKDFAAPGETVAYTVVVTNDSDVDALNTVMTDTLPIGFVFKGSTDTVKNWDLGTMAAGQSRTITYDVTIDQAAGEDMYTNTVTVTANDAGLVSDTATVEVRKPAVLGAETEETVLPVTGGSLLHVLYVLGAGLIVVFSGFILRLTSSRG